MNRSGETHCLLDCYATLLNKKAGIDSRPLYIGVWDAYFDSNESGFSYHSDIADPKDWFARFRLIYGITSIRHENVHLNRQVRFNNLVEYMKNKPEHIEVIMLVDLFYLSYSQQYQKVHTPHHYVVLEHITDEEWYVKDPYFAWEGTIPFDKMSESFLGSFIVDMQALHAADAGAIISIFEQDMNTLPNRLIVEIERFVCLAVERNAGYAPESLFDTIEQAIVISKRFWGYRHVYEYFSEDGEDLTAVGNELIACFMKGLENLLLSIVRYGILKRQVDLKEFSAKVDKVHNLEIKVRTEIIQVFSMWKRRKG